MRRLGQAMAVVTVGATVLAAAGCGGGAAGSAAPAKSPASSAAPSATPSPVRPMAKVPAGTKVPLAHKGTLRVCEFGRGLPYLGAASGSDASVTGNGKVRGFDVDMLTLVAARLRATPLFVRMDVREILEGTGLRAKACDIVPELTAWRGLKKTFTLTRPYSRRDFAILTKKGGPTSLAALRGKRVGVSGSEGGGDPSMDYVTFLKRYNTAHGNQIRITPEQRDDVTLEMLKTGRLDAIVTDSGKAFYDAGRDPALTAGVRFGDGYTTVFGVRKGNRALAKQVDAALTDAAANGHYAKAYRDWFHREPTWRPGH